MCRLSLVDIPDCSQNFKMSSIKEGDVEIAMISSLLCIHACVRVKNDDHLSGNAWP